MTSRLRQFEAHGIVTRTTYAEIPHRPGPGGGTEQAARDTVSGLLLEVVYDCLLTTRQLSSPVRRLRAK